LIDPRHDRLSIRRQCDLLDLSRNTFYYLLAAESPPNLAFRRLLHEQYLKTPFWGSRNMTTWLRQEGHTSNRKRVQRLMRLMRLEGLSPRPRTTKPAPRNRVFRYLLRDVKITQSTDISVIPMRNGFLCLVAVLDWHPQDPCGQGWGSRLHHSARSFDCGRRHTYLWQFSRSENEVHLNCHVLLRTAYQGMNSVVE